MVTTNHMQRLPREQFRMIAAMTTLLALMSGLSSLLAQNAPAIRQISVSILPTYSDGHTQLKITLHNGTVKTITGWSWQTSYDGAIQPQEHSVDFISDLLGPDSASRTFRPGTTHTFEDGIPGVASNVTVALTAVLFDDVTAIGDKIEIERWRSRRRSRAAQLNDELNTAERALHSSSPHEALREEVRRKEASGDHALGITGTLFGVLEQGQSRDSAEAALTFFRDYRDLMVKHAEVR